MASSRAHPQADVLLSSQSASKQQAPRSRTDGGATPATRAYKDERIHGSTPVLIPSWPLSGPFTGLWDLVSQKDSRNEAVFHDSFAAAKRGRLQSRLLLMSLLASCLLVAALYIPHIAKVGELVAKGDIKSTKGGKKRQTPPSKIALSARPLLHELDSVPPLDPSHPAVVEYNLIIPPNITWRLGKGKKGPRMQHAITLIETSPGEVLASWFGGTWEGRADTAIYSARYTRERKWTDHSRLQTGASTVTPKRLPLWNPVLCSLPESKDILLMFKRGANFQDWYGLLMRSKDGGLTWSTPSALGPLNKRYQRLVGPAKNKCLSTKDGTLLAGASREFSNMRSKTYDGLKQWNVHIEYSKDGARTWQRTPPIPFQGRIIQPALFLDSNGSVCMLARQRGHGEGKAATDVQQSRIVFANSNSADGLNGWMPFRETTLPCPNSGLDAVRLKDGRILVIYNHSNRMGTWGRMIINAALSYDDGETWRPVLTLDQSLEEKKEFSYPAVIQAADNQVHIGYTFSERPVISGRSGRDNLRHIVLDPGQLDLEYWRAVMRNDTQRQGPDLSRTPIVRPAEGVQRPPADAPHKDMASHNGADPTQ